jgi:hypothetical protein
LLDEVSVRTDPSDAQAAPEEFGRRPDCDDAWMVRGQGNRRVGVQGELGHCLVDHHGTAEAQLGPV